MSTELDALLAVMARLRAPDGCPWDREQTLASLAPYTLEEAYEVVDAIESGDLAHLQDELGDLLLQVVFQSQIAAEAGAFDFAAVAAGIRAKLLRRHPHLFADATVTAPATAPATPGIAAGAVTSAAEQTVAWEAIKAAERRAAGAHTDQAPSQLDGIARALPALLRADKLSKRAARVGFDFKRADEAADKVAEELAEVREAALANAGTAPSPQVCEEVGDLLFAAVNLARKLGVDPEAALRAANAKFERRFRGMEVLAAAQGGALDGLDLIAQERLWQEMKRRE
jgi:ATP diphosphatase